MGPGVRRVRREGAHGRELSPRSKTSHAPRAVSKISALVAALLIAAGTALAAVPSAVEGRNGMVVTEQRLASEVGVEILKAGGNAVDAAVATAYALAVVHPCCGNLGGGGFMTLHLADGREAFLDFREKAPLAASPGMYLDDQGAVVPGRSLKGYLAVAVPGTPLGLDTALRRWGTMDRRAVMAPAIRLAEDGLVLGQGDVDILAVGNKDFATEPNVADIFLKEGRPLTAGDRLVQPQLAATLRALAEAGPDVFYRGPIGAALVKASAAHGGILTAADLEAYSVEERPPLRCAYRGYAVVSAPPPSSGGVALCEILGIIEAYPLRELGFHSAEGVHLMVEAMRHAFVDRNAALGDPAFVKNPVERLLSAAHAAAIRARIEEGRATPSSLVRPGTPPHEGTTTTHLSVVDRWGNAVALTTTVNRYFGAKIIAGETGFFLNDEMDDFTAKPGAPNSYGLVQGAANAIAPGKRPLSSLAPTILARDGRVFLVLGTPGGSRIITILAETIVNILDHGMTLAEAVDAPRFHHQWLPDAISTEPFAFSPDTERLLRAMGYALTRQKPWGAAEAILVGPGDAPPAPGGEMPGDDFVQGGGLKPGVLYGVNDARRPAGGAIGY